MGELDVRGAGAGDHGVLERLWTMFQHDMSEFTGSLPAADGTFRDDRLRAALSDPAWAAHLFARDGHPVGFALVRGLDAEVRVLNSFFVVRAARRHGVGLRAVREVVDRHPGAWEVAFQDANPTAVRFWRHVAAAIAPGAWTEERRPVPARPDLAPDVWIAFHAGP